MALEKVNINFKIRTEKRQRFREICQADDKTVTQSLIEYIDRVIRKADQSAAQGGTPCSG